MHADGKLTDDLISAEIEKKNHEFIINALALMVGTDLKRVCTIFGIAQRQVGHLARLLRRADDADRDATAEQGRQGPGPCAA